MAMRSGVSCWRCAVFLTPPRDALRGQVRSLSGEALAVRGAPLREGCGHGSARSRVLCLFYSGLAPGWLSEPWKPSASVVGRSRALRRVDGCMFSMLYLLLGTSQGQPGWRNAKNGQLHAGTPPDQCRRPSARRADGPLRLKPASRRAARRPPSLRLQGRHLRGAQCLHRLLAQQNSWSQAQPVLRMVYGRRWLHFPHAR